MQASITPFKIEADGLLDDRQRRTFDNGEPRKADYPVFGSIR